MHHYSKLKGVVDTSKENDDSHFSLVGEKYWIWQFKYPISHLGIWIAILVNLYNGYRGIIPIVSYITAVLSFYAWYRFILCPYRIGIWVTQLSESERERFDKYAGDSHINALFILAKTPGLVLFTEQSTEEVVKIAIMRKVSKHRIFYTIMPELVTHLRLPIFNDNRFVFTYYPDNKVWKKTIYKPILKIRR